MNDRFKGLLDIQAPLLQVLLGIIGILLLMIVFNYIRYLYKIRLPKHIQSAPLIPAFITMDHINEGKYILVDQKTKIPRFVSNELIHLFHLEKERLNYDLEYLFIILFDEKLENHYWKEYVEWDGQSSFVLDVPSHDNRYFQMECKRLDHRYDLISFVEITNEIVKEKELLNKIKEMEEISNSKTAFLTRMSHEIRTPMNGIIGMLTLAKDKIGPQDELNYYLNQADNLSMHLLSLINDILDMSRIEAGKLELENQPFRIRDLGDKLAGLFQRNIEAKGIHFAIEYYGIEDEYVIGDELRLSQVLANFLSNAQKFTEKGEIIVTFRLMQKSQESMDLMIRVHDTGKGMAPEFINHIFNPFEQENSSISKNYGGSGLGMAISDQIINLMGGEIVVDSKVNQGSDFSVFIQLPLSDKQFIQAKKEKTDFSYHWDFKNKHILYAEDNDINAEIGCSILENKGAIVLRVQDGLKAVEAFKEHDPYYFDCILMDIQMPKLDGREAAREIRALERIDASSIPIFALSADAFVEDQRLSLSAGMNGHFEKPANFNKIETEIERILMKRIVEGNDKE